MALDATDIQEMYQFLFYELHYPMSIEEIDSWEMIVRYKYQPEAIKEALLTRINNIENHLSPADGWRDIRSEKELPVKKALCEVLFCPLEEVPLHINGKFLDIAKWRLENAK